MINIDDVTSEALLSGIYEKVLPEYYDLKKKRENNGWHQTEESIFVHCVSVFEQLETNKKLMDLGKKANWRIVKIATLLHDIAKVDTWAIFKDGTTLCPGHEVLGSDKVILFKDRFSLTDGELGLVKNIVLHHGVVHDYASRAGKNSAEEEQLFMVLQEYVGEGLRETLLLVYADIHGCDVKTYDPEEFKSRGDQVVRWLEKL